MTSINPLRSEDPFVRGSNAFDPQNVEGPRVQGFIEQFLKQIDSAQEERLSLPRIREWAYFRRIQEKTDRKEGEISESEMEECKKLAPPVSEWVKEFKDFLKRVRPEQNPLIYQLNLLLHADPQGQDLPALLAECCNELQKATSHPDVENWLISLHALLSQVEDQKKLLLIKGLIPLFSDRAFVKNGAICCEIEKKLVWVPQLSSEELQEFLRNLPLIQKTVDFSQMFQKLQQAPLPEHFAAIYPFLQDSVIAETLQRSPEDGVYLFQLLQKLVPLMATSEERTKKSCGTIRFLCHRYQGRLSAIPEALCDSFARSVRIEKKEPWKKLWGELLSDLPSKPSAGFHSFFMACFRAAYLQDATASDSWQRSFDSLLTEAHPSDLPALCKGLMPFLAKKAGIQKEMDSMELKGFVKNLPRIREAFPEPPVFLEKVSSENFSEIYPFLQDALIGETWDTSPEDGKYLFQWLQKLVPLMENSSERTRHSCGTIRHLLSRHARDLSALPESFWESCRAALQIEKREPWKKLWTELLSSFPENPSPALQEFFKAFFFRLYGRNSDFFDLEADQNGIEKVCRAFQASHLPDPFEFERQFSWFLGEGKVRQALNLLQYQGTLEDFLVIQNRAQRTFFTRATRPDDRLAYLNFLKKRIEQEKDPAKKFEICFRTYSYMYQMKEVQEAYEELCLGQEESAIESILTKDREAGGDLQDQYKAALKERIKTCLSCQERPSALRFLQRFRQVATPLEITDVLVSFAQSESSEVFLKETEAGFSSLWKNVLQTLRGTRKSGEIVGALSQRNLEPEIKQECFSQWLTGEVRGDFWEVGARLLKGFDAKAKIAFVSKCMKEKNQTSSLPYLTATLEDLAKEQEPVRLGSYWSLEDLKFCMDLAKQAGFFSSKMADMLYSGLKLEESLALAKELFPFLSKPVQKECLLHVCRLIDRGIAKKTFLQELLPLLDWMHQADAYSIFSKDPQFVSYRKKCALLVCRNLENFDGLLRKKAGLGRKDTSQEGLLQSLRGALQMASMYFEAEAQDEEKVSLLHQYAAIKAQSPEVRQMVKKALAWNDPENLRKIPWKEEEIVYVFDTLCLKEDVSQKTREEYVQFSLDQLRNISWSSLEKMAPHAGERSMFLVVEKLSQNFASQQMNLQDFQNYLSIATSLERKFFEGNVKFYAAFLKMAQLYLMSAEEDAFDRSSDLIEKIGEFLTTCPSNLLADPEHMKSYLICSGKCIELHSHNPAVAMRWFQIYQEVVRPFFNDASFAKGAEMFSGEASAKSISIFARSLESLGIQNRRSLYGYEPAALKVLQSLWKTILQAPSSKAFDRCVDSIAPLWVDYLVEASQSPNPHWMEKELKKSADILMQILLRRKQAPGIKAMQGNLARFVLTPYFAKHPDLKGDEYRSYLRFLAEVSLEEGETLRSYAESLGLFVDIDYLENLMDLYGRAEKFSFPYKQSELISDLDNLNQFKHLSKSSKLESWDAWRILQLNFAMFGYSKILEERLIGYIGEKRRGADHLPFCEIFGSYFDTIWNVNHVSNLSREERKKASIEMIERCFDEFYDRESAANTTEQQIIKDEDLANELFYFLQKMYINHSYGFLHEALYSDKEFLRENGFSEHWEAALVRVFAAQVSYDENDVDTLLELDQKHFDPYVLTPGATDRETQERRFNQHRSFLNEVAKQLPVGTYARNTLEERIRVLDSSWVAMPENTR